MQTSSKRQAVTEPIEYKLVKADSCLFGQKLRTFVNERGVARAALSAPTNVT